MKNISTKKVFKLSKLPKKKFNHTITKGILF